MKILICGATGFVGSRLTRALQQAGHTVIRAVRKPTRPGDVAVDFCKDTSKEVWLPRLEGISAVVNAVGILRDNRHNPMQKLLKETPVALFAACAEAKVEHIIHLSALGVDSGIDVPYFSTRLETEKSLRQSPARLRWLCLRPSVIYGEESASTKMFLRLAKLPIHFLPMGGTQSMQPVHIDDICNAVTRWLADTHANSQMVEAVGAKAATMREMLDSYRKQLQRGAALHLAMPKLMVRIAALLGDIIPSSPLCSETYAMLFAENTAETSKFATLLGREPRSFEQFID